MIEILILILVGLSIGLMDLIDHGKAQYGDFFNASGWTNKWKLNFMGDPIKSTKHDHPWYLQLYQPEYVERFPFSSTLLVALTDGWHLLKEIVLTLISILIVINSSEPWFNFFVYRIALFIGFAVMYYRIKIKVWFVFAAIVAAISVGFVLYHNGITSWSQLF